MRRHRPFSMLAAGLVASCGHAVPPTTPAPSCAPTTDAEAQIVQAVVGMYDALRADDATAFRARTTSDFYAFEGKRMDGDELVKVIAEAHAKGRRFEWSVKQPTVRVDCNLAFVTYVNEGATGDESGMQPKTWLESAVVSYEAGSWRIRFFHSAPVPKQ